jgi:hypothetical protein
MQSFRQGVLGRKSQQKLPAEIDARLSELETDDLRGGGDQDQNQREDRG